MESMDDSTKDDRQYNVSSNSQDIYSDNFKSN